MLTHLIHPCRFWLRPREEGHPFPFPSPLVPFSLPLPSQSLPLPPVPFPSLLRIQLRGLGSAVSNNTKHGANEQQKGH